METGLILLWIVLSWPSLCLLRVRLIFQQLENPTQSGIQESKLECRTQTLLAFDRRVAYESIV